MFLYNFGVILRVMLGYVINFYEFRLFFMSKFLCFRLLRIDSWRNYNRVYKTIRCIRGKFNDLKCVIFFFNKVDILFFFEVVFRVWMRINEIRL